MKRLYSIILTVVILSLTVVSCKKDDSVKISINQKPFYDSVEYGIYDPFGEDLFAYNAETAQVACSDKGSSRIMSDDLSKFVNIVFKGTPKVNSKIKADVFKGGIESISSKTDIELMVLKKQGGKLWLWNKEDQIGYLLFWE